MKLASAKSIRAFIGAQDYQLSRQFYHDLGFEEVEISHNMCLFKVNASLSFYLQDYYRKDWIDNSMVFLEVEDVDAFHQGLTSKALHLKYDRVTLSEIKTWDWGREIFMHDPSGVLWHFGSFESMTDQS